MFVQVGTFSLLLVNISSLYALYCNLIRNELKKEGSGRGNWGTPDDEIVL